MLTVDKRHATTRYSWARGLLRVLIDGTSFMLNVTAEQPGVGAGICCVRWNRSMESN